MFGSSRKEDEPVFQAKRRFEPHGRDGAQVLVGWENEWRAVGCVEGGSVWLCFGCVVAVLVASSLLPSLDLLDSLDSLGENPTAWNPEPETHSGSPNRP